MNDESSIHEALQKAGGLKPGAAAQVSRETGAPEADIYGVGSFYHLLSRPDAKLRVCTGMSCLLAGADKVLAQAEKEGLPVEGCSCLAGCDVAPAVLKERRVLPGVSTQDMKNARGDWKRMKPSRGEGFWAGVIGPAKDDPQNLVLNLAGEPDWSGKAFQNAQAMGAGEVMNYVEKSGLKGRGGAGFPAHIKWRGVHNQKETKRYVVLNADEGEPGTFKDREILLRRPDLVLEGLAIAARAVGAEDVYLYLRGEFEIPWGVVEDGIARAKKDKLFPNINFHMHAGQGAYICGEETALLEALEGKRGMPRLKPPFPVEVGLWGKPTLIHNVETIACIPPLINKGPDWFTGLGRTEPGTKLYCISGHVKNPGTYELPFGISLEELVAAAGGYVGTLKAFSPGGASSGFLPADQSNLPLDFKSLAEAGSMLGSAGVVVLNDSVDMKWAAREQLRFFEDESCGQCAPCRIGTRFLRETMDRHITDNAQTSKQTLSRVAETAWQMNEGSICGLGMAAPLPLTSAIKYFPEEFGS